MDEWVVYDTSGDEPVLIAEGANVSDSYGEDQSVGRDLDIANAEIALRHAARRARERARRAGLKVPVYRGGQVVEVWPAEQDTSDVAWAQVVEQEVLDLFDESST